VNSHRKALSALLLGASLLGFSAIFVKWTLPASPLVVGFYRMLFALPVVCLLYFRRPVSSLEWERGVPWAILGGLCFSGDLSLWHTALRWTSAASATLLVGLAPLWVSLVMVLFFHARLRKRAWLGLTLALGGAVILSLAKGARIAGNFGEIMGGLASFCYAAYALTLSRARRHLDTVEALFWVVLTSLCFFGIGSLLRGDNFGRGFPLQVWFSFAGIGLLVQVCGWWLITWGLGRLAVNVGSVGLLMQPVATVILGWVLLHEALLPAQGMGTVLILIGIALTSMSPPLLQEKGGLSGLT
jgi:drug/metabolite transporter (DMT)-like permease